MDAPRIAVLVGLQGAGKSTFYRRHLAATHAHVSRDDFPNARKPLERQERLLREALAAGGSAALDNTNATAAARAPVVALARELGVRVEAYFFDCPVADCAARNARRTGRARVPPVAVYATARRLEPPSLEEGFDRIWDVRVDEAGFTVTLRAGA